MLQEIFVNQSDVCQIWAYILIIRNYEFSVCKNIILNWQIEYCKMHRSSCLMVFPRQNVVQIQHGISTMDIIINYWYIFPHLFMSINTKNYSHWKHSIKKLGIQIAHEDFYPISGNAWESGVGKLGSVIDLKKMILRYSPIL